MVSNPFVRFCARTHRFSARAPIPREEYSHVCKRKVQVYNNFIFGKMYIYNKNTENKIQ